MIKQKLTITITKMISITRISLLLKTQSHKTWINYVKTLKFTYVCLLLEIIND